MCLSYELRGVFFVDWLCLHEENSVFDVVVSNRIERTKYVQKMHEISTMFFWGGIIHYRFLCIDVCT